MRRIVPILGITGRELESFPSTPKEPEKGSVSIKTIPIVLP